MRQRLSINFSPRQGGANGGGVTLDVFDIASGTKILSIDMTHEEAGKFVTSQAIQVTAFVSDDLDRVGLIRENKQVPVPALKGILGLTGDRGREIVTNAVAQCYEIDGWTVDARSYIASQKRVTTEGIPLVPFYRYVKEKS